MKSTTVSDIKAQNNNETPVNLEKPSTSSVVKLIVKRTDDESMKLSLFHYNPIVWWNDRCISLILLIQKKYIFQMLYKNIFMVMYWLFMYSNKNWKYNQSTKQNIKYFNRLADKIHKHDNVIIITRCQHIQPYFIHSLQVFHIVYNL